MQKMGKTNHTVFIHKHWCFGYSYLRNFTFAAFNHRTNVKDKQGFTLLEMVVVVSVLSVMFLLTIPNIQKVMDIVERKGCDALVKVVDSAILQYKLNYDEYPGSVYDLVNAGLLNNNQIECSNGNLISISDGQAYAQ